MTVNRQPKTSICANCGVIYELRKSRVTKYCSRKCMYDARRKPLVFKNCQYCGQVFQSKEISGRPNIYCSKVCRIAASRETYHNLAGQTFGRLTAIGLSGERSTNGCLKWDCECSCGKVVAVIAYLLTSGSTKSCGCLSRDASILRFTRHGLAGGGGRKVKLYGVWNDMRGRCNNPSHHAFRYYGGRGITICKEWMEFKPFYDWAMANGYKHGLTLDRTNNERGYMPQNCRWVTHRQQCRNRSSNIRLTYKDKTRTLVEWGDILGINYGTLRSRLYRNWSTEKTLETPVIDTPGVK